MFRIAAFLAAALFAAPPLLAAAPAEAQTMSGARIERTSAVRWPGYTPPVSPDEPWPLDCAMCSMSSKAFKLRELEAQIGKHRVEILIGP